MYTFHETEPDYADSDALLLARSYFDVGEFARAAHTLDASCRDIASASTVADVSKLSPKALALRCYSLYMASRCATES